jgi:hypothetical protein
MHCIYQIDKINYKEEIIDIANEDDFLDKIIDLTKEKNPSVIENIEDVYDKKVVDGLYLMDMNREIRLVDKYTCTSKGYVYDSHSYEIKELFVWKLVPINSDKVKIQAEPRNIYSDHEIVLDTINMNENVLECESSNSENDNKSEDTSLHPINSITFNEFNLDNMRCNQSYLLIGKRGSGKSYVALNIMRKLIEGNQKTSIMIISPTERLNPFYSEYFPEAEIHYDYDPESLESFLADRRCSPNKRKIVVVDNCMVLTKNDTILKELIVNNKYFNTNVIMTIPTPFDLCPVLGNNFDYVFSLSEHSLIIRKRLWTRYAMMFPSFDVFNKYFSELTANYGCMVISNRDKEVLKFRADTPCK